MCQQESEDLRDLVQLPGLQVFVFDNEDEDDEDDYADLRNQFRANYYE